MQHGLVRFYQNFDDAIWETLDMNYIYWVDFRPMVLKESLMSI